MTSTAVVTIARGRHDHLAAQHRTLARGTALPERYLVVAMGDDAIVEERVGELTREVVRVDPWAEDDWQAGVPDQSEKELAAYASVDGQVTLMGLDTHARELNSTSTDMSAYSIGGLPANTMFNLALWNVSGNGENSLTGTLTTDAAGVARFDPRTMDVESWVNTADSALYAAKTAGRNQVVTASWP